MTGKDSVSRYALPHIRTLQGYTPGFQPQGSGWIKLNTNENPYPPSPTVEQAIKVALGDALRLYPDPRSSLLREEAARVYDLAPNQVVVGNGSDDILNLLVRTFATVAAGFPFPSYSLYPVLCSIQNSEMVEISYDRSMELPLEALANSGASLLFLTSPNAPTGVGYSNDEIRELLSRFEGIVVLDEAYGDFARESAVDLLPEFENLVVTRTLSKSYGLAGLRVGFGLAHSSVIEALDRVRDSYNVNRLSQAGGVAALRDQSYMKAVTGKLCYTRDFYRKEFEGLGWFTYESRANFIFTEPVNQRGEKGADVARGLFEYLKAQKILVRYFPGHVLTESFLRISVGDEEQMLFVSETIQQWLKTA